MTENAPVLTSPDDVLHADSCTALVQAAAQRQVRLQALVHGHYPGRKLARSLLPGVKTVGFWDASQDQQWGLDWHRNEGIELTLLDSGSTAFATDGYSCRLKPGDLTITRPWQRHRVGDPHVGAGRLNWLILDVGVRRPHQVWRWPSWIVLTKSDLAELTNMLRHNEQPVWRATHNLRRCFQQIGQAVESDREGNNASQLIVRLNELFLLVLAMLRHERITLDESLSETQRTVELFLTDLRENLHHLGQEWTVRRMARRCGLGVTQFVHHCRNVTNLTPMQYLNRHRLEAAAKLLTTRPDMTVIEIAQRCGFNTSQYFATAFRKELGSAPSQYRLRCAHAEVHHPAL